VAAGVCLRQPDGVVVGEVFGEADPDATREQVARILSLDVDGTGFPDVGAARPGGRRAPGPLAGAAAGRVLLAVRGGGLGLVGHRIRIVQAARIKQRMADELGQAVDVHGDVRHGVPRPGPPGGPGRVPGAVRPQGGEPPLAGRGGRGRPAGRGPATGAPPEEAWPS
jgi:DNA-3-methyladenine glycosylase II